MKTIPRILSAALLLMTLSAKPLLADGGNPRPPMFFPGLDCAPDSSLFDGSSPRPPMCFPGLDCGPKASLFDGGLPRPPMCFPGLDCVQ